MSQFKDDAHYEALLMKAVDGLLTEAEEKELSRFLDEHPERLAELDDFRGIKDLTDRMTERLAADAAIEPFRESSGVKGYNRVAFVLVFAGLAAIVGFAFEHLLFDAAIPKPIRYGAAAAGAGALMLFARALWIRVRAAGRDPYEEIDR